MPVVTFPPPWETGPGAADPAISKSFGSYTGPGYYSTGFVPFGQSTINVGNPVTVPPAAFPAQVRFFVGADGNLYALEHQTGQSFMDGPPGGSIQPANYTPTR